MVQVSRKKRRVLGILLLLVGLSVLLVAVDDVLVDETVNIYSSSVNVYELDKNSSDVGLGVNAGRNLDFGDIPVGTNVTKKVKISTARPSTVDIQSTGNISQFLHYDESILIDGEENVRVKINPEKAGNYTGKIEMRITIPRGELGQKWLSIKSRF